MVFAEIQNTLTDFSNLSIEALEEESVAVIKELEEMQLLARSKIKILQALEKELVELKLAVESLEKESDRLKVELIRVKTQQKKLKKNLQKLKNIDTSRGKVEASDNDKMRLAKNKTKLDLMKKLSSAFINSVRQEGFISNPLDLQLQPIQLNKSRQVNRNTLWIGIGQCAQNVETWNQLF